MQKSKSESNLSCRHSKHNASPRRATLSSSFDRVESVNARFRTDPLLNEKMMEEFRIVEKERRKSRDKTYATSPRLTYLSTRRKSVKVRMTNIFEVTKNWDLSALSHFFLDQSVLVNYNHLMLEKLQGFKQQKLINITPYILYLFRRLLQMISIALVSLFVIILYAMSKNSDKINIPSALDQVPESLENIRNIILDELITSILNETDRVYQRWTESDLEPALSLMNDAKSNKDLNIVAKHPIIVFPGITTNSLELWQSDIENDDYINNECGQYIKWNMRQRIWGSAHSIAEMFRSPKCWLYHMMLNESTGFDSNGIKLRSIEGPTGADYLFPGYWIWALILDNLATVGYDTNMIYFANFDWRLSRDKLNDRDGYWSRCKFEIELRVKLSGEKAVLIGHSMGANMVIYFLQWVTSNHAKGGKGGKDWVNTYIDSSIMIAGSLLGAPKIVPMYLFGETSEIALLSRPLHAFKEMILPRTWFNRWIRSVHGGMQLAPIGGELIWGNSTYSVEDAFNDIKSTTTLGSLLNYVGGEPIYSSCHLSDDDAVDADAECNINIDNSSEVHPFDFDSICCKKRTKKEEDIIDSLSANYTASNWTEILRILDETTYNHLMTMELSAPTKDINISQFDEPMHYGNPLWRSLPFAPNMKIYCMYGTNIRTERNYYFMRDYNASFKYAFRLNINHNDEQHNVRNGVKTVNGDGTVPLLSLGFMCSKGWRNNKRLNPSGIKTKIVEYRDKAESLYERGTVRGGKESGDHVDILGNHALIRNILLIAMGYEVEEIVHSNIHEMSQLIDI